MKPSSIYSSPTISPKVSYSGGVLIGGDGGSGGGGSCVIDYGGSGGGNCAIDYGGGGGIDGYVFE